MNNRNGLTVIAAVAAQLAACSVPTPSGPGAAEPADGSTVAVREDLSGRFIAVIGPKILGNPSPVDPPDTNYSCLRSFIDRRTGATAHQLYVAASYDFNHDWTTAHDAAGRILEFIPISRLEIACDSKHNCSYAEEFAAELSKHELTENPHGFSVTFSDRAGNAQKIGVSADQIAAQLAALTELQKSAPPAAAQRRRGSETVGRVRFGFGLGFVDDATDVVAVWRGQEIAAHIVTGDDRADQLMILR
jgi:hypothetical protein